MNVITNSNQVVNLSDCIPAEETKNETLTRVSGRIEELAFAIEKACESAHALTIEFSQGECTAEILAAEEFLQAAALALVSDGVNSLQAARVACQIVRESFK